MEVGCWTWDREVMGSTPSCVTIKWLDGGLPADISVYNQH